MLSPDAHCTASFNAPGATEEMSAQEEAWRRHARSAAAALSTRPTGAPDILVDDDVKDLAQMGLTAPDEVDLLVHAQS
jgi:hypothetical protein